MKTVLDLFNESKKEIKSFSTILFENFGKELIFEDEEMAKDMDFLYDEFSICIKASECKNGFIIYFNFNCEDTKGFTHFMNGIYKVTTDRNGCFYDLERVKENTILEY